MKKPTLPKPIHPVGHDPATLRRVARELARDSDNSKRMARNVWQQESGPWWGRAKATAELARRFEREARAAGKATGHKTKTAPTPRSVRAGGLSPKA